MKYVSRNVEDIIKNSAKYFPCLVIYGPRQVGKSTTIYKIFNNYKYVTLDDINNRTLAIENPKKFLEFYGWPLIIDEIQKAPGLLDEIKINIDKQRLLWLDKNEDNQLMYIVTGSNRFELQQGISDSLAGRCGIIQMFSFCNNERFKVSPHLFQPDIQTLLKIEKETKVIYQNKSEIFETIFKGGMPNVVLNQIPREEYFRAYVNTYIEKDVKKLISEDSEITFRNFIAYVALRTGQELKYDVIANAIGIDVRTCKKWISILETSGIIFILQPYMANVSNRIIKTPKLYFLDTGLCAYLCRWPNATILENCAMDGAFFETYIVSELVKNLYSFNIEAKNYLFYYRDRDQKEIDIIYSDYNGITPIEIKKSTSPKKPTKNFSVLKKYNQTILPGLVIDCTDKIFPINENSYAIPAYLIGA